MYKLALLTVSLPPHRLPPHNRYVRWFFVSDYRKLAMHIAETFATITILGLWCLDQALSLPFFLPFAIGSLIPVLKIFVLRRPSLACLRQVGIGIGSCLLAPL